ncbi:MAG: hypothetical protein FWE90_03290 [Defluviitaleaceae bacterium]|nr:hypothetical protein [Defluviitaleaceae bacterium]
MQNDMFYLQDESSDYFTQDFWEENDPYDQPEWAEAPSEMVKELWPEIQSEGMFQSEWREVQPGDVTLPVWAEAAAGVLPPPSMREVPVTITAAEPGRGHAWILTPSQRPWMQGHWFVPGTRIEIFASPAPGFAFSHWTFINPFTGRSFSDVREAMVITVWGELNILAYFVARRPIPPPRPPIIGRPPIPPGPPFIPPRPPGPPRPPIRPVPPILPPRPPVPPPRPPFNPPRPPGTRPPVPPPRPPMRPTPPRPEPIRPGGPRAATLSETPVNPIISV